MRRTLPLILISVVVLLLAVPTEQGYTAIKKKLGLGDTIDFTAVTKTNQGTGSGLDADLLDGKEASEFLQSASSSENTFKLGDGNNTDKYYQFDKGGSNLPGMRWNASGSKVQISHDGTSYQDIGTSPVTEEGDTQKVANTTTTDFDAADFVVTESPTNEANIALEDAVKFSGKTTDDLPEGSTNLYHTDARFDTRLGAKTTDDLTEGATNKYNPFGTSIDSGEITDTTIVNADVSGTAAIAESKLSLNYATHSNANDPSSDEKGALAGTSGTPSATNKYVTNSDSRLSGSTPDSLWYNIALNTFRMMSYHGAAAYNMIQGWIDEFEDEISVDTGSATGQTYDATNDLYYPTLGLEDSETYGTGGTDDDGEYSLAVPADVVAINYGTGGTDDDGQHDIEAPYTAQEVTFDSNDYLLRGGDLTSNADGKVGIFSIWLDLNGGDGGSQAILRNTTSYLAINRTTANKIEIIASNSSGTNILTMLSTSTYTASSGRIHILASWDLAATTGKLYINDSDDLAGSPTFTNDTIDYTRTEYAVGSNTGGSEKLNADAADLYFNNEAYLDLTVTANRRKFINANGNPVDLGSDGSTPTSAVPRVFLHGAVATWHQNDGDGGNFSVNGGGLTDGGTFGEPDTYVAQSFAVGGSDITATKVRAYMLQTGSADGSVECRIETDNANKPSGTLAFANATKTITAASISGTAAWTEFVLTASGTLSASTKYWKVTKRVSSPTQGTVSVRYDGSSPGYASGACAVSTDAGSSWTVHDSSPNHDCLFEIYKPGQHTHYAQKITLPSSQTLGQIRFYMRESSCDGNVKVEIQGNDVSGGDHPDGTVLTSVSVTASSITDTNGWNIWDFSNYAAGAIKIWPVIYRDSDTAGTLYIRYDGSSPGYSGGGTNTSTDDGATWGTEDTTKDLLFRLEKLSEGMSLPSVALTADAVPTEARLMLFIDEVDAFTINTDVKGWASRDNGVTYTQVTLAAQVEYETGKKIYAGTADISGQPSGTAVKWRVTTHESKNEKLEGVTIFAN